MIGLGRLTALVVVGLWMPVAVDAQADRARLWVDGGLGLMVASDDGLDGPILYFRSMRKLETGLAVGPRFEFRDDDPDRGRAQVLSGGVEAALTPFEDLGFPHLYFPVRIALDLQHVQGDEEWRLVDGGIFPRIGAGIGLRLNTGAGQLRIEQQWSGGGGGGYRAITVGLSARDEQGPTPTRRRLYLVGHSLYPAGGTYAREPDYRGYSLVYERGAEGSLDAWRGSLGIDFLDFAYSTGVITALVGPVVTVARGGAASVVVVGQVGAAWFGEGGSVSLPWAGYGGMEGQLAVGGAAVILGVGAMGMNGPEGLVVALQPRFGVAVGL